MVADEGPAAAEFSLLILAVLSVSTAEVERLFQSGKDALVDQKFYGRGPPTSFDPPSSPSGANS